MLRPILFLLALTAALAACGSDPSRPSDPEGEFVASIDPEGSVVLKRVVGPDQVPLDLVAIGAVRIDRQAQTVSLDVAVRNAGDRPLAAPVIVQLGQFEPDEVFPANADWGPLDGGDRIGLDPLFPWGFQYDPEFGDDGQLAPGETSDGRTWTFSDPGLGPFSFAARAVTGPDPDTAVIGGQVFVDDNRNGAFDDFELPYGTGAVSARGPDGETQVAPVGANGRYRLPVSRPGLYSLVYDDFTDGPWCTSTPNPLQVLVTPGPDGEATSFEGADFGWVAQCGPEPPIANLVFTERPLEEFEGDPYTLIGLGAEGNVLTAKVGFSGCDGGHPVRLIVSRHVMESMPPQTHAILQHDSRGELCAAWFEEERRWDLSRILEEIGAESLILRVQGPDGGEHRVEVGDDKRDG